MQVRFAARRKEKNGQGICRNCESGPLRAVDPGLHAKAPAILAFEAEREESSGAVPKLSVASTHQQGKTVSQGQIWLMLAIRTRQRVFPILCKILSAHRIALAINDSVRGLDRYSWRSSGFLRCLATSIEAAISNTRLRPSSIQACYTFRLLFV